MLTPPGDAHYMAAALALSERGRGRTGANPNVGCLIVQKRQRHRPWLDPEGRSSAWPSDMALAKLEAREEARYLLHNGALCHEAPGTS